MKLNKKEIHILHHSLGLNQGHVIYRNRFCTGEGSEDYPTCEKLVKKGFMEKQTYPLNEMNKEFLYTVTPAGRAEATRNHSYYQK